MNGDTAARILAEEGLRHIERAVLMLLEANPQGLGNSQIASRLGLHSDMRGQQRNYLTYSVLGRTAGARAGGAGRRNPQFQPGGGAGAVIGSCLGRVIALC